MQYEKKAKELRAEILKMLYACQSGHPGGSLSCVEMLMALYYEVMKVDPKNPKDPNRDRFVLSKGHACPTLYAILADLGYFPKEDLANLRQIDSHLQGHPDCNKTPGVDMNTGSLGQGASLAMGLALAAKHAGAKYHVYSVLGDGECQEGLVWEAAMAAAHYKLDNLCIMVDVNGLQIDGATRDVMNSEPLDKKMDAFGFNTIVCNGNSFSDLEQAFKMFDLSHGSGKPTCFLLRTTKGLGVSYMENAVDWHGKAPNDEEYAQAMTELRAAHASLEKEIEFNNG
mgnify:CR=1 FL=1